MTDGVRMYYYDVCSKGRIRGGLVFGGYWAAICFLGCLIGGWWNISLAQLQTARKMITSILSSAYILYRLITSHTSMYIAYACNNISIGSSNCEELPLANNIQQQCYNCMECLDFRNGSYQGSTKNKRPHGLGILIDHYHLFCLAHWHHGHIRGPTIVIFPDRTIFCGHLSNNSITSLSCFFLPDNVQIYLNKSKETGTYTTVLPSYQLILEIDGRGSKAKVVKHHNYPRHGDSQEQQLQSIFGDSPQLQHLRSWKDFLTQYFLRPHPQLLMFSQLHQLSYIEHFLRLNRQSMSDTVLGVKAVEVEQGIGQNNDPVIVTAVGNFTADGEMIGYGRKVADRVLWRKVQEGEYTATQQHTIEYIHGRRPKQAFTMHRQHLLKSLHFSNQCFPLKYLYSLQAVYAQVNVQMVQQTQKIAQVVLHQGKDSRLVLVEIENKKSRKRTPIKDSSQIQESMLAIPDVLLTMEDKPRNNYFQDTKERQEQPEMREPKLMAHPDLKLSKARTAIFSSVEKIKKGSREKRDSAEKQYRRVFIEQDPRPLKEEAPIRTPLRKINESPMPKNGIEEERCRYRPELPTYRQMRRSPSYDRPPQKVVLDGPSINNINIKSSNFRWNGEPLRSVHNRVNHLSKQNLHRTPQREKKGLFDQGIDRQYARYRKGQQQMEYFNALIQQQEQSVSLHQMSEVSDSLEGRAGRRQRSKTPGMIRRVKLRSHQD